MTKLILVLIMLQNAKILGDWAGLRPQRTPVRLEREGKVHTDDHYHHFVMMFH